MQCAEANASPLLFFGAALISLSITALFIQLGNLIALLKQLNWKRLETSAVSLDSLIIWMQNSFYSKLKRASDSLPDEARTLRAAPRGIFDRQVLVIGRPNVCFLFFFSAKQPDRFPPSNGAGKLSRAGGICQHGDAPLSGKSGGVAGNRDGGGDQPCA